MKRWTDAKLVLMLALLCAAWTLGGLRADARTPLDPQAVPPRDLTPALDAPRREIPLPIDPDADVENCAVCRLAALTTGKLAKGSFQMLPEALEDGISLRVTSSDRQVREALWKATLDRAALLETLRHGDPVHLCAQCKARLQMLADLKIAVRRIPEGLVLVYTSESPAVVRHIQTLARNISTSTARF